MNKKKKGIYGYRDQNRRMRLSITLILVAAILLQLAARSLVAEQAAKNILTVMAILTVLPMANMASPLLASWKYRTPELAFYERVHAYEDKCVILYDLILTTSEQVLPMDAIAVHPNAVIAYCPNTRIDRDKAQKALNDLFVTNRLEPSVRILTDEKKFLQRLDNLKPAAGYEDDGLVEGSTAFLKSLSM